MRYPCCVAVLTVSLLARMGQASGIPTMPAVPAERWRVEAVSNDVVHLTEQGKVLVLDYDVTVRDWHQTGHLSLKQASVKLLLREPVALTGDTARVVFEAWGHGKGTWQLQDRQTQFRVLLRDASGEFLSYNSYEYPHLKPAAVTWARWMSSAFYAAEAGGATHDVFESWGGDGNAWPDGALTFVGFEITVRRPEFGRCQGRLALGEMAFVPARLPWEAPFAYADGLLPRPGTYQLAARISRGYQQPPCAEQVTPVTLKKDDLDSARQKIAFTLGGDGDYWITWQLTDEAGRPVAGDTMRTCVLGNPKPAVLTPVDVAAPPVMGCLRVNWARHTGGVYEPGEPMNVDVRIFPKGGGGPFAVEWKLLESRYDHVLQSGSCSVPDGGPFHDVIVTPAWEVGRDAYRLRITLRSNGKPVDEMTYELGRRSDPAARHARAGKVLDREIVKQGAYFRLTYLTLSTARFKSEDEALADLVKQLDEMVRLTPYITTSIDIRDLEVLPGVFDFALQDRIMDAAADRGAALTVRFVHIDQGGLYTWHPYYRQYNYDGTPIDMHYYGGFSLVDPRHTELWHRAYKAMYDRYGRHPGFQGYYVMEPAGEATVADKPFEGVIAGYEPPMVDAFRAWLRAHEGYGLSDLSRRWGRPCASWDAVDLPMPDLAAGAHPDLRLQWVDFCRFKAWLGTEGWFPLAAERIRRYDTNHVIIAYAPPKHLPATVDYGHNGGNHMLQLEGQLEEPWTARHTGWISEPHHPHRWAAYGDPAEMGWVLDWTVWVATAQAGGGGANFHAYYDPRPGRLIHHYGTDYAFDRLQKFRPICEELQGIRLVERPFQVAALQDLYTLYCKHRTTFMPRTEDLKRWFERLKDDSVRFEDLNTNALAQYKLVLPNLIDDVMSEANLLALDDAVRSHGAKLIMSARTGCYCPERGGAPFQLLRQFGIAAPTGDTVQDRGTVRARVTAANPLFATSREIAFFNLADLKHDLQSKEIRDNFWKYPYRWIPQTDYFGYYPRHQPGGDTWAVFPEGGVAVSHHRVGKGEVVVFWGIPDYRVEQLGGFMARAADWAGVEEPAKGAPIPRMLEATHPELGRRYVLLYHETPGTYAQPFPSVPDGAWFVDELVADQKLGTWTGAELRGGKLPVTYVEGCSPLKIYRLSPAATVKTKWVGKYRQPGASLEKP